MSNLVNRITLYKFAIGTRVIASNDFVKRVRGTVQSRVPCAPAPMYYVVLSDNTRQLFAEAKIEKAPAIQLRGAQ